LCRVYKADFPPPKKWKLIRLDICYNWKFPSREMAEKVLETIKNFSFPYKKEKKKYKTSVMFLGGRNHSIKFYLKEPEYYKHDFKILKNNPRTLELAYSQLSNASGILRFEATLWSKFLHDKFPNYKQTYHIATQYDKISYLLGEFVRVTTQSLDKNFMNIHRAKEILMSLYEKRKALDLLKFWVHLNILDSDLFDLFYDLDRSNIYRKKRDIKSAGLGMYISDDSFQELFDLSIPSPIVSNPPLLSPEAEARASGGEMPSSNTGISDAISHHFI